MNLLKKIIFGTAVFALSINALYLIAPLILQPHATESPVITIPQSIVILIFSFVISLSNRIFDAQKLHKVLKLLIHFAAITISFIVLFSSWNPEAFQKPSAYFVAIFLFAAVYSIVFAGIMIGKKIYAKSKISKGVEAPKSKTSKKNEEDYKPRFK